VPLDDYQDMLTSWLRRQLEAIRLYCLGINQAFGSGVLTAVLFISVAVSGPSAATNDRLPINDLAVLQYLLIWTGDYVGIVDGIGGPLTEAAIRQYEARSTRQPGRLPTVSAPGEALIRDAVEALLVSTSCFSATARSGLSTVSRARSFSRLAESIAGTPTGSRFARRMARLSLKSCG
jgi:peptidoglycan hydrolase-like protein with peptidoglycan-binding domain